MLNTCAHRICRTTEPCRYGDPMAPEQGDSPWSGVELDRQGDPEEYVTESQTGAWQVDY